MSTQPLHRGEYLPTGLVARAPRSHGPGPLKVFLSEAAAMFRGAIEAPLREARRNRALGPSASLDAATRRDIGL